MRRDAVNFQLRQQMVDTITKICETKSGEQVPGMPAGVTGLGLSNFEVRDAYPEELGTFQAQGGTAASIAAGTRTFDFSTAGTQKFKKSPLDTKEVFGFYGYRDEDGYITEVTLLKGKSTLIILDGHLAHNQIDNEYVCQPDEQKIVRGENDFEIQVVTVSGASSTHRFFPKVIRGGTAKS